jgi:hypothetical protein
MTKQILITFQDEKTGDLYLWNGKYPIGLSGGWDTSQKPWHSKGTFSQKEADFFKELETNKARTFTVPSKGKFKILNRLNVEIHDGK